MTRTRNRFAALIATALISTVAIPATASALGPGGWDHLGQYPGMFSTQASLNGLPRAFNTDLPGKLIAGGSFTGAGVDPGATTADDHIAVWDGTSWSTLGPLAGLGGDVFAVESDPATGKIYAGGSFTNAGGDPALDFLAMWDTNAPASGWQPMCANLGVGGNVKSLKLVGSRLFVGGEFADWDGPPNFFGDGLFECDTAHISGVGNIIPMPGMGGSVLALAASATHLYAGGNFVDAHGNGDADYVVKYGVLPALTVSGLGAGNAINTTGVDSLATIGSDVYVGTDDIDVGLTPAEIPKTDHVGKYNSVTNTWAAPGFNNAGTDGYLAFAQVNALATSGSTVFAAGNWSNANGEALADSVGAFNSACTPVDDTPGPAETCWDNVGHDGTSTNGPFNAVSHSLTIFNGNLIAGGNFQNAGGDTLADFISCRPLANPCITPPPGPPVITPPSSTTAIATIPDPVPPVKCKKTQKLKNGKCVKKKKKKKKKK